MEVAKPRADKVKLKIAQEVEKTGLSEDEVKQNYIELIKERLDRLESCFKNTHNEKR